MTPSAHRTPPRYAERILRWLLDDDWDTPAGDFEEYFNRIAEDEGPRAARRWYRLQVVRMFPGRILERSLWGSVMFANSLKVAYRTLRRHPGFAAINIGGLAIGLAACLLIALLVIDELSFDRQFDKADRIVRVVEANTEPDGSIQRYAYTFNPLGTEAANALAEIESSTSFVTRWSAGRQTVQFGENRFYESGYFYVDSTFFNLFEFRWIEGSVDGALSGPLRAVLTESAAEKYFGDVDPVGKLLSVERDGDYTVVGVIEDPPANSHFDFSMLLSLDTLRRNQGWSDWLQSWNSRGMVTYLLLSPGTSVKEADEAISRILDTRLDAETQRQRHPYLQALADIHLHSTDVDFEENAGRSSPMLVYLFSAIAVLILLIASINYTNMSVAGSLHRAREVGLRKTAGAHRTQLVRQFLAESVLTMVVALIGAVAIVALTLPAFNAYTGKALSLTTLARWEVLYPFAAMLVGLGFLSGGYPAILLSRFHPASALKGQLAQARGSNRLRQALVVAQFGLSIGLIMSTLIVSKQLDFIRHTELGFESDGLVVVDINSGSARSNFASMKQDLAGSATVQSVSVSSNVPGDWKNITQIDVSAPDVDPDRVIRSHFLGVDADFLRTYDMELVQGRNFRPASTADSLSVLVNEKAAERLRIGVGDRLRVPVPTRTGDDSGSFFEPTVVGIVRDFNFMSLHDTVGPIVLAFYSNPIDIIDYYTIRLSGSDLTGTMSYLRSVGERYDPDHPFEYNFLDDRLEDFYRAELQTAGIFRLSSGLAIFLACLGLLGLSAYTTARRTREIGIRKALGASVPGILALLSRETMQLIALAFVIAAPVDLFLMARWLDRFAYRAPIDWTLPLTALLLTILFALLTVSYQTFRAASVDPVESLRYE